MRIRKRKVPLPFHLVSPVPIPPSFFSSSSDPDPTTTTTTPPSPLVQLRHDTSGTRPPIPTSDDDKAGATRFGSNPTDDGRNRKESHGHLRAVGSAHPIYPISWDDGKEGMEEMKRSTTANNYVDVAASASARKGSKCSSSSSDPETLGLGRQQQHQQSAAAAASSSASTSHLPLVGAMSSTWCKEYHYYDHQDMKSSDDNNKSSSFLPSRKRSSWSSSSSSSTSASSYFDISGHLTSTMIMSPQQQIRRPQGDQNRDTKLLHCDIITGGVGVNNVSINDKKKRSSSGGGGGRGGGRVLMEGSRCSRVNGRGWRCSQPTLVGYSLCEHHLGKGRMRSMTAASSAQRPPRQLGTTNNSHVTASTPSTAPKAKPNPVPLITTASSVVHPLSCHGNVETDTRNTNVGGGIVPSTSYGRVYYEEEEEKKEKKKMVMMKPQFALPMKKKTKLGTVKARSISSLLDQPDNTINAVPLLDR